MTRGERGMLPISDCIVGLDLVGPNLPWYASRHNNAILRSAGGRQRICQTSPWQTLCSTPGDILDVP